jgi:hypothetical protein
MPRRTKKQKTKIAKRLAMASLIIGALTLAVREGLKERLKDIHDSAAKAEAQYRTESGQTVISLQLLIGQEQAELQRIQDRKAAGKQSNDFSMLIAQDITRAQQALSAVDVDFDSASRLIDALPSRDLRKLRDDVRASMDKMNAQVTETLKPSPEHDLIRFINVKLAMVSALLQGIPIALLSDQALTVAHRVEEATEKGVQFCNWLLGSFALIILVLGMYAVNTGVHSDGGGE